MAIQNENENVIITQLIGMLNKRLRAGTKNKEMGKRVYPYFGRFNMSKFILTYIFFKLFELQTINQTEYMWMRLDCCLDSIVPAKKIGSIQMIRMKPDDKFLFN
ncbi:hypothetical protein BpHYR1_022047 [Brachionus plicatilis]|uniref:Uncharacterized protein n=1 Tax=Brachionus plicatilis TaxID=10195 RepID=A0A3M7PSX2_BRAPC|nr:hypothetical protein BpHYR1_022047 [Brachionus plicatilis]